LPIPTKYERRAEGVSRFYRPYIVIEHRKQYERENGILPETIGRFLRRHPILHAVRGHFRRLRSGRDVFVRPHLRGEGEAVQVKDYIVLSGAIPSER
jgi:hypothetical protein